MDLDDYQQQAATTAVYPGADKLGDHRSLPYLALKLNGEAGEVAELVGKWMRGDDMNLLETSGWAGVWRMTPERHAQLKKELGDVLWYVANLAGELGFDLSDIAKANLTKLKDRQTRGVIRGSGGER